MMNFHSHYTPYMHIYKKIIADFFVHDPVSFSIFFHNHFLLLYEIATSRVYYKVLHMSFPQFPV